MLFKCIIRELRGIRDGIESNSRRQSERKSVHGRGKSHIAPERPLPSFAVVRPSHWANVPPELLLDIIQRVDDSETSWPARRDVVACAAVCSSWRETTKEVVRTPEQCGLLTFPMSLKQHCPGIRVNCCWQQKRSEWLQAEIFLISLVADDFSQASDTYVGKLRSNFLGTKFVIYDSQPPGDAAI